MRTSIWFYILALGCLQLFAVISPDPLIEAYADSLGDYKKKKHDKRKRVTKEICHEEYILQCKAKCKESDNACKLKCSSTAKEFCAEREKKRRNEQIKLAAKGATLAVGVIGVLLDDEMPKVGPNGQKYKISPYTKFWNRTSITTDTGFGVLEGGANGISSSMWIRKRSWGIGGQLSYLWQGDEYLMEGDIGPTFYLPSASIVAGIQPSLLVSSGNNVQTEYGFGVRAPTNFYINQSVVVFSPLLGTINNQWFYHLKVAFGYRFHPNVGAFLGYEYRDIVDLNDLDISTASLQGAFLYLRLNQN